MSAVDLRKLVATIGGGMGVEYAFVDESPFERVSLEATCLNVKSSAVLRHGGMGSRSLSREGLQMWLNSHLIADFGE